MIAVSLLKRIMLVGWEQMEMKRSILQWEQMGLQEVVQIGPRALKIKVSFLPVTIFKSINLGGC